MVKNDRIHKTKQKIEEKNFKQEINGFGVLRDSHTLI